MYGKTDTNLHVKFDVKFHYDAEKVVDFDDTIDNPTRVEVGQTEEKHVDLANLNDSTANIDQKFTKDQKPINPPTSQS